MNWVGIGLGLLSALLIGMGFVWVIRVEYYLGAYWWKAIAAAGLLIVAASLFMPNFLSAAIVGILGGCVAWGAFELPHQQERVDHGLFRAHPNRAAHRRATSGEHDHSNEAKPGPGKWWSF